MKKGLVFLIIFIITYQSFAQSWHFITPVNGHLKYNDVSFVNPNNGFAVGDNGVIFRFMNGKWSQMESRVSADLYGIEMLNNSLAFACGNGVILKFDGTSWQNMNIPMVYNMKELTFPDENHGWAIGNKILYYDGEEWNYQQSIEGRHISCFTPDKGYATALSGGIFYEYMAGHWYENLSFLTYNITAFDDVQMLDTTNFLISYHDLEGNGTLFLGDDTGISEWATGPVNHNISFLDLNHGYGLGNRIGISLDTYPSVYRLEGNSWIKEYSAPYDHYLTTIEIVEPEIAFCADTNGFIYSRDSNGWGVSNGFTADSILDCEIDASADIYLACGTDGIWHYNGEWNHELLPNGYCFSEIDTDGDSKYAAGWRPLDMPAPYNYEVVLYKKEQTSWIPLNQLTSDIAMPITSVVCNGSDLYFSSWNLLYYTTDNINLEYIQLSSIDSITGLTIHGDRMYISAVTTGDAIRGAIYSCNLDLTDLIIEFTTVMGGFYDINSSSVSVIAVGQDGVIVRKPNAGNWIEFESSTDFDLFSVALSDNGGAITVGKEGTILEWDYHGWDPVNSNTSKDLHTIELYNEEYGLIGGQDGTLLSTLIELPVKAKGLVVNTEPLLEIYPNPSYGEISILSSNKHSSEKMYQICDLSGKVLQTGTMVSEKGLEDKIDINSLSPGTFIIRVISDKLVQTGKIIAF